MYIATPRIGPRDTALVTGFALLVDGCIAFVYGYLVYRGFCTLRTVSKSLLLPLPQMLTYFKRCLIYS